MGVARQADLALVACHPQEHPLQSAVVSMLGSLTTVEDGRLYSFSVQQSAWHLVQADGQIFLINTVLDYPSSVASQALEDLRQLFGKVTPERLGKATSGSLSGSFRAPFAALCAKYDDVAQVRWRASAWSSRCRADRVGAPSLRAGRPSMPPSPPPPSPPPPRIE